MKIPDYSKKKNKITYLEMIEEIKRLKEEYMILQNASDKVEDEKDREIERLNKQLQLISDEFLKYDWENSSKEQMINQLKSLYNSIFKGVEQRVSEEDTNFLISIQDLEQPEFDNACLERENKRLSKEIERLNNIIKEVREYIEENLGNTSQTLRFDENKSYNTALLELLEILDKDKPRKGEVMPEEELEEYEPKNMVEQEYYDNFWD